jgi:DnaJ-class molecular chaperone
MAGRESSDEGRTIAQTTDAVLRELDTYRAAIGDAFREGFDWGASDRARLLNVTVEAAWQQSEARQREWEFAHTRMSVGAIARADAGAVYVVRDCPTCGGEGEITVASGPPDRTVLVPCPDCTGNRS